MNDCVFCGILDGSIPASVVYRDDQCVAFLDIQPINPGHLLIVPNQHAAHLADIDAETAAHLFRVAHRLAAALRRCGVRCEGINMFLADGEAAMQEILHVHLHVFPRYRGDGFGLTFSPSYFTKPPRSTLADVATQIRAAL